jgi:aldehyde dehydrogenase (NAD+)
MIAMTSTASEVTAAASGESLDVAIDRVFARQRARFAERGAPPAADRIDRLRRLKSAFLLRQADVYRALEADFRKHAAEVELTEIQPTLVEINYAIKHVRQWMRSRGVPTPFHLAGTKGRIRYEPKGTVLILAPWNYPFYLLICPLVGALAAGNTVVLKPSEKVPATSALLAELVRATFDESEVAIFEGGVEVAQALLARPFDHFFYTGSTRVGRVVMEAAARHLATVTLELGGKSPAIVDETADLESAVNRIVWGKFINGGQTCVAPDYVLVHESRFEQFVSMARAQVSSMYGADEAARKANPDFCRLVDDRHFCHVAGLLEDALAHGARAVTGGVVDAAERYVSPTILTDVDVESTVMNEEIFGPLLPVLPYSRREELPTFIKERGKPLALYVFSTDPRRVAWCLDRVPAGGSAINNVVLHLAHPSLPFGGAGESGMGSYHGEYGFRAFSHERAVLIQGPFSIHRRFQPPYTDKVRRLVALVTRFLK